MQGFVLYWRCSLRLSVEVEVADSLAVRSVSIHGVQVQSFGRVALVVRAFRRGAVQSVSRSQ